MKPKDGMRVKATREITTRWDRVPVGSIGTVIAVLGDPSKQPIMSFTVEWDDPKITLKHAFDTGTASRTLEIITEEVDSGSA